MRTFGGGSQKSGRRPAPTARLTGPQKAAAVSESGGPSAGRPRRTRHRDGCSPTTMYRTYRTCNRNAARAGAAGSGDGGGRRATGSRGEARAWKAKKNWGEEGEKLMRQVRDLGRYPMESTNRSLTERLLAERLSRALNGGKLSPEFVAELQVLRQAGAEEKTEEKMQEVRGGNRYPMESRHDPNERQEADKPPAKKHKGTPDDSWQEGTIPVTIRMILDAHDCYGGSVGTLIVNGRGASMCMLVAQVVEKALKPDMPGRLILDDASGRIPVEVYRDQGQMTDEDELPRVGEYVRVVGTLSSCSERVQLTCRFIGRLVNDSEIPCHLIEVAHASLKLRLAEKLAMTRDKENTVNSSLPRDRSNISVVGPSDHWLHKDRSVPAP